MTDFLDLQIQVILVLQNIAAWLQAPMQAVTFMGTQEFYLLVAPAIYWCLDAAAGLRFGLLLLFTGSINAHLKYIFHAPRPFWVSDQVIPYAIETTFGMPSGHAQNSVVVFGSLASHMKSRGAWLIAIGLSLLIGISRIYLGAHFISDVLVGWLIGAVLLTLALRFEKHFLMWMQKQSKLNQYLFIFLASLIVIGIGWGIGAANAGWETPAQWADNVYKTLPEDEPFATFDLADFVSFGGTIFGLAAGAVFIQHYGGFSARGTPLQRILRYLIGIIVLVIFFFGLDAIFPEGESLVALIFRYLRYGLVGAWLSAIAPLLFKRLNLAE